VGVTHVLSALICTQVDCLNFGKTWNRMLSSDEVIRFLFSLLESLWLSIKLLLCDVYTTGRLAGEHQVKWPSAKISQDLHLRPHWFDFRWNSGWPTPDKITCPQGDDSPIHYMRIFTRSLGENPHIMDGWATGWDFSPVDQVKNLVWSWHKKTHTMTIWTISSDEQVRSLVRWLTWCGEISIPERSHFFLSSKHLYFELVNIKLFFYFLSIEFQSQNLKVHY
jgi:hypothetical protein